MSLNKKLDVYVINLNERTDRWKHIIKQFNNQVNLIRVEAIKDKDGVIGCFKSHKKCLKIAKDKKLDQIIVIEDDCLLTKLYKNDFNKKLTDIISFLKQYKDWDLFLGGATGIDNNNIVKKINNNKFNLLEINKGQTTHFMIYNKSSYDFIINADTNMPIDNVWYDKLRGLTIYPFIAQQLTGYSNIINRNVLYYRKFRKTEKLLSDYIKNNS